MTCCIGMAYRGGVLLGHDACVGSKEEFMLVDSKAYKIGGATMLYCGDMDNAQRLVFAMGGSFDWPRVLEWYQEHPDRNDDDDDKALDLELLVRTDGELYYVGPDGGYCPVPLWAIGTGAHYARGALRAAEPESGFTSLNRASARRHMLKALRVAGDLCPTVREPYTIL